jgi:hypothetical protein
MPPFIQNPHFCKPGGALYLLLIFLAIGGVLFPQSVSAAIAYVHGNNATPSTPQSTVQVAYTKAQNAGDLNVVIAGWNARPRGIVNRQNQLPAGAVTENDRLCAAHSIVA